MLATIAKIVISVISIAIIVLVMLQRPKEDGISGAALGQSGNYADRLKGASSEAKLALFTKIAIGIFVVATVAFIFI
ncbi:preprotein translocase subunit SecG [Eubacteriales bacterium OttesenSCG-928-N14]|nr:preprotein translocase subunit SecG [Eubacteriales bacterium OttesenSCG-928-N14]